MQKEITIEEIESGKVTIDDLRSAFLSELYVRGYIDRDQYAKAHQELILKEELNEDKNSMQARHT